MRVSPILPLLGSAWVAILMIVAIKLDLHNPPAVSRARFLLKEYKLVRSKSASERLAGQVSGLEGRSKLLRWAQKEFQISNHLRLIGDQTSAGAWAISGLFQMLLPIAAVAALDGISFAMTHTVPVPIVLGIVVGLVMPVIRYVSLRGKARAQASRLEVGFRDMLVEIAILSYYKRINPRDRVELLARCHREKAVHDFINGPVWRSVVNSNGGTVDLAFLRGLSAADEFEKVGRQFDLSMLKQLAAATRQETERGMVAKDIYKRIGNKVYQRQLAEARLANLKARNTMTIFVALMLIPLLTLFGAPVATIFGSAFK